MYKQVTICNTKGIDQLAYSLKVKLELYLFQLYDSLFENCTDSNSIQVCIAKILCDKIFIIIIFLDPYFDSLADSVDPDQPASSEAG